jgi:PAS domain S-box-containing protein
MVLDSATDFAIISLDLVGRVTSWNPGAEQLLGWAESEIVGQNACIFFTPEDQARNICDLEMAVAAREGRAEDERWHLKQDGGRLWASGLMMRFGDQDSGEHIGYIKILRDRTRQHEAEQRLRASQQHLQTALTAGKLGTWELDLREKTLTCSDGCKANFGRASADAFGYLDLLSAIHADDLERMRKDVTGSVEARAPYDGEYRTLWPDGSVHTLHVRGVPQYDPSGAPDLITGVVADVSQHVRDQEALHQLNRDLEHAVNLRTSELSQANEALRAEILQRQHTEDSLRQAQKMEAVGQLTGGVAHDFNNLLTIIRGSIDLLKRPELSEDKRQRYLTAISDTADRAATLTSQLLAFARRQPLNPEIFDPGDRIEGLCEMLCSTLGSHTRISIERAPDSWPVKVDASQFDTAILNLAVNARDAMPDGGRITLRVQNAGAIEPRRGHAAFEGEYVALSIVDAGAGIPDELIERIFELFFTTKAIGKGTGLGLSQVIGFAKQSGGDVAVESKVGVGTRLTLYLPRSRDGEVHVAEAVLDSDRPGVVQGCVLVVEDNQQVGDFATTMIEEIGAYIRA